MIMLLYYIHDLVLLKQIQRRMHFNTLCAVSMIQNVSQNRTDKKITKEDLDRIFKASYMAVFSCPEKTLQQISGGKTNDATYFCPVVIMLEGTGNNKCKVNWYCYIDITDVSCLTKYNSITSGVWRSCSAATLSYKNVTLHEEIDAKSLYDDLYIQNGEIKVVVETNVVRYTGKTIKEIFGFHMIEPEPYPGSKGGYAPYFYNHVIFSPRPGIFDPTTPPQ